MTARRDKRGVLVFGATSAIGAAVAREIARRYDAAFYLVARDAPRLSELAADLEVRGASRSHTFAADLRDAAAYATLVEQAVAALGEVDVALFMQGVLPDQAACEGGDRAAFEECIAVNLSSVMALALLVARHFERAGRGTLVLMGSAAGDRGRRGNYLYGAGKAALAAFASGLRARLAPGGAHVLLVKPGLVDTPMTARFTKGPLWAQPDRVARAIVAAIEARRGVVYVPWFWRPIMLVIRALPWPIFRRLSI